MLKKETIDVRRIGTALIGGDFTGNARGTYALDVQTGKDDERGVPILTDVASGDYATAYGFGNEASGNYSIAIGRSNTASAIQATAIGRSATASGVSSIAIGYLSQALGETSIALGYNAVATPDYTANIAGLLIIRKDTGESEPMQAFSGAEVIILTGEIDLKVVADQMISLTAFSKFWWNECGVIATDITIDAGNQPTIRFGVLGNLAKQVAAAITTNLTAEFKREIEIPLVPEDGDTTMTAGVTIGSTYTTCKGRFYFKGMFVEDE